MCSWKRMMGRVRLIGLWWGSEAKPRRFCFSITIRLMTVAAQTLTPEQELQQIVRRMIEAYAPDKIILFGSYAYGKPDRESDFDLFIMKETDDPPHERRYKVRKMLWPLPVKTPVEPWVLTQSELNQRLQMKDQFFEEIVLRGRVLYG